MVGLLKPSVSRYIHLDFIMEPTVFAVAGRLLLTPAVRQ